MGKLKTEKLLTFAIVLEFVMILIGVVAFDVIIENKHAANSVLTERVSLLSPDTPEQVFSEKEPIIEVEKTSAQWATQIQDVAKDTWNHKVSFDVAEDIFIFANLWSEHFDIDLETVLAQCGQESWFTPGLSPKNKNGTCDYGVMGVNDLGIIDFNNAHWKNPVTVEQVQHDINIGIMVGCWNYANKRRILEGWGVPTTEENILYAYNGGQGRVRENRVPEKTKKYYQDVQNLKTLFL